MPPNQEVNFPEAIQEVLNHLLKHQFQQTGKLEYPEVLKMDWLLLVSFDSGEPLFSLFSDKSLLNNLFAS
jgi:hypothetical protein